MQMNVLLGIILAIFGWGIRMFLTKLSSNRIGQVAVFWDILSYSIVVIIYSLIVFKAPNVFNVDRKGILIGVLTGVFGAAGLIGFYYLVSKAEVSTIVPIISLYPAIAIILGLVFLRESITVTKVLGIIFSLVAIYLLNR
jgi:transporter family protein